MRMNISFKRVILVGLVILVNSCQEKLDLLDLSMDDHWDEITTAPVAVDTLLKHDDLFFVNETKGWLVTRNGHIYHTVDGGESWAIQYTDSVYWRCIGFANELNGWAGNKLGDEGNLLYQTKDGGENWSLVNNIPDPVPAGLCGINVYNNEIVNACGRIYGPGVFIRSEDSGETWVSLDISHKAEMAIDLYFWNEMRGIIVGGTDGGFSNSKAVILQTEDAGATWERIYLGARNSEWCWKISFPTENVGFISIQNGREECSDEYFLKTIDGGETWQEHIFFNESDCEKWEWIYSGQAIGFFDSQIGWIGSYFHLPTLITVDGGQNWYESNWGYHVNRIRFISDNIGYASGETVYKFEF